MESLRSNSRVTPRGSQSGSAVLAGKEGANLPSGSCTDCADKNWNCPHPQCGMSSDRNWNVKRHIQRRHQGIGMPSHQDDIIHKMCGEDSTQKAFASYSSAVARAIAAGSLLSSQQREKNTDLLDHTLPILRKFAEYTSLLEQLSSHSHTMPTFFPNIYWPTYGTVIPLSNNNRESLSHSFLNSELQVVGYLGFLCDVCLVNHPLAIYSRKLTKLSNSGQQEIQTIRTEHQCNIQRAVRFRSLPMNTKTEIILNLFESLPETVLKKVNAWTDDRPCLVSRKFPPNVQNGNTIDLFPENENHWSIRATKNRQILFNNLEELKDFIMSARNATLGLFRIHSNSQDKEPKVPYFIAVTPSYD